MARSFLRVQAVNPGFRSDSVLSFEVQLPDARYPDDRSKAAFFPQLFARLEALPGVQVAGAISYLPLGGGNDMGGFLVEGNPSLRPGEEPVAERRVITPEYFAVMGIPLQQGRTVTATDTADQPLVAVINQRMANRFFQEENPLGRRIKIGTDQSSPWRTVIGVAADVKSASLEADTHAQIYLPHAQWPLGQMSVVLLANGDPRALASTVRSKLKELDALLPAAKLQTMQQVVSAATRERRFNLALMVFFASTALGLTMIGIYGVVAFLVGRQIREIGIRLALGASRTDILRLILQQGMKPVVAGSLAGLVGSLLAARAVASQLYSVLPWDPLTFAVISALVFFVALLACWLPARRAARVDPTVSLRQE
jgi:putative ABC transport system permease protein